MAKVIVYIDGFNLYYGCLKNTPHRWLNLDTLCSNLLKKDTILKIKYFTALATERINDPRVPQRQQVYLRALRTIPNLEIHLGHFLSHVVSMPKADLNKNGTLDYVKVIKTEEKGSDVNLASHLLSDAFRKRLETAIIISNDSDLLTPIRIVKSEIKIPVGILNPHKKWSRQLVSEATFMKPIRSAVLQISQFPPVLKDSKGTITKPSDW